MDDARPAPLPPALPRDYLLVAFEVTAGCDRRISPPSPGACAAVVARAAAGARGSVQVRAVAWFAESSLDQCEDGRERLVSEYDAVAGQWSEWRAETRVSDTKVNRFAKRSFGVRIGAGVDGPNFPGWGA